MRAVDTNVLVRLMTRDDAKQLAVAIVSKGNLFLTTALQGLPLARLVTYTPERFTAALKSGESAGFDVVILDGWLPPVGPDQTLPPGRWLILNGAPGGPRGLVDKGVAEGATIVDWDRDHPVTRPLVLDNIAIADETFQGKTDASWKVVRNPGPEDRPAQAAAAAAGPRRRPTAPAPAAARNAAAPKR